MPRFVLHEHRKPRHHFDLRLEEDGVLRSWAVPRGLPQTPSGNRLAVAVPDHDLDHLTYEDADKSIADIGTWEEHDRTDKRLLFTLHGRTGSRRYALIRTDSRTGRGRAMPAHTGTEQAGPEQWLIHLTKEQPSPVG